MDVTDRYWTTQTVTNISASSNNVQVTYRQNRSRRRAMCGGYFAANGDDELEMLEAQNLLVSSLQCRHPHLPGGKLLDRWNLMKGSLCLLDGSSAFASSVLDGSEV